MVAFRLAGLAGINAISERKARADCVRIQEILADFGFEHNCAVFKGERVKSRLWSKERTPGLGAVPRPQSSLSRRENLEHNLVLVEALRAIAAAKESTVAQVAIAWVLSRGEEIVPLIGAAPAAARFQEALGALELVLSADDLA